MANSKRPHIHIQLKPLDVWIEILSVFFLFSIIGFAIYSYQGLPDQIPIHFNGAGKADAFEDKSTLFHPIIVLCILYAGLTVLNRFPHLFNYLEKITEENARKQYALAGRMMRFLKLGIVCVFGLISFSQINSSVKPDSEIGEWVLPIVLFMCFSPIIWYLFAYRKIKRH